MSDGWHCHRDGHDMAVEMGGRLLVGMAVGAAGAGVLSVVAGGLDPLCGTGFALFMLVSEFCICCIV